MRKTSPRRQRRGKQTEDINWGTINNYNVEEIVENHDTNTVKSFIKQFRKMKLSENAEDYNNPSVVKFVKLCQVSCDMLVEGSIKYKSAIQQKNEQITKLQDKYKILEESYKKARNLLEQLKGEINPCPVCNHKFKSPEFLDKHFRKAHPELIHSWNNIRQQKPDIVVSSPDELSKQLYSINKNVSGNELQAKKAAKEQQNSATSSPARRTRRRILPVEPDSDINNFNIIDEESSSMIETQPKSKDIKPHVKFFDYQPESDDGEPLQVIPQTVKEPVLLEEVSLTESPLGKIKKKIRIKRKERAAKEQKEQEEEKDTNNEEQQDNTLTEETKDNISNGDLSNIDEGRLETTLIDPADLDIFYDNNPTLSYIQLGIFDESTFVDEEPPLLRG